MPLKLKALQQGSGARSWLSIKPYRGISPIRNPLPVGPYSRAMPRALWWSWGGWRFLISEVPSHVLLLFLFCEFGISGVPGFGFRLAELLRGYSPLRSRHECELPCALRKRAGEAYPSSGDEDRFDPQKAVGHTVGRMRLRAAQGIQGYLAHNKTPTPLGSP